ncbi:F-box and WD domain-containing protein [Apiospora kogelbergensis]|uniref:F-box and WD domain-containing protein n=1 Tax=Apiospora kogelbergensis TaxID=1337665 RepID=A0AAW0QIC0_9PEZI
MVTNQRTTGDQEDGIGTNKRLANDNYAVGWICAILAEYVAAREFLDDEHEGPAYTAQRDSNSYTLGRMGRHNIVIAVLPRGEYGTASAATVASNMLSSFPNIRIGLMVGIGGGVQSEKHDIRLGDIVVSAPGDGHGGVFQYDFGKTIQNQTFQHTRFLEQPPALLRAAIGGIEALYVSKGHQIQDAIDTALDEKPRLQKNYRKPDVSTDRLYRSSVTHPVDNDASCATSCSADPSALVPRRARDKNVDDDPTIHYGLITSGNQLMNDAMARDRLSQEKGVLCFEMEAAGLMNNFPCLVIRGICDYADSHKNKEWQGYAAMTAAAYAKDVLKIIAPSKVEAERKIKELFNKMNESLQVVRTSTIDTQYGVEGLKADGYLEKIGRWLSPPDPSTNINKAREQHHNGTGQWLLNSDQYSKWKRDRNSFFSTVIADLGQSIESESLIYFYFNFNDIKKQSLKKALYYKRKDVRADVDTLYRSYEKGKRQPSVSALYKLFQGMLQQAGEVWLVLDALDEYHPRDESFTNRLLPWIKRTRECGVNVHTLVTSRPEYNIKAAIAGWACNDEIIPLQSSRVNADITAYVEAETKQMTRYSKGNRGRLEIKGGRDFDTLKYCLNRSAIRRELANLPRTLDATYARILLRVLPEHIPYITRLLQFLAYSERPLRLDEAVDALAVDTNSRPRFNAANRTEIPEEIVAYCAGLVVLVKRKAKIGKKTVTEIQLAHLSVQEYLTLGRLKGDIAHDLEETVTRLSIVTVCLSYLLDIDHSYEIEEAKEVYPLAQYSATQWTENAAVIESLDKPVSIPEEYFSCLEEYLSDQKAFDFGYQLYRVEKLWTRVFYFSEVPVACLFYTSGCGLYHSTRVLLEKSADVHAQSANNMGNALQAASLNGHEAVVRLLLDRSAHVNAQGGEWGSALQAASLNGHEAVVRLLLDRGADVNAPGGEWGSALQAASLNGHEAVVRLLLDRGAHVNASDGIFGNSLQRASEAGHDAVVLWLINRGAHVNASDGIFSSALQVASEAGHEAVVRLLIDRGAELHVHSLPMLMCVASQGYEAILRLLLEEEENADVSCYMPPYGREKLLRRMQAKRNSVNTFTTSPS